MNDRKQTPDILAEMLGGEIPASPAQSPSSPPPAPAKPRQTAKPRNASRNSKRPSTKLNTWEYKVVSFQEYRGWRPRYVNGLELPNWMEAPLLHDYLDQMGADGWELATASSGEHLYGLSDKHQLYFKRLK